MEAKVTIIVETRRSWDRTTKRKVTRSDPGVTPGSLRADLDGMLSDALTEMTTLLPPDLRAAPAVDLRPLRFP